MNYCPKTYEERCKHFIPPNIFELFSVICWKSIRLFVAKSFGCLLMFYPVICNKISSNLCLCSTWINQKVDKRTFESRLISEREEEWKITLCDFSVISFREIKCKNHKKTDANPKINIRQYISKINPITTPLRPHRLLSW